MFSPTNIVIKSKSNTHEKNNPPIKLVCNEYRKDLELDNLSRTKKFKLLPSHPALLTKHRAQVSTNPAQSATNVVVLPK